MENKTKDVGDIIAGLVLIENEALNSHQWRVVANLFDEPVTFEDYDRLKPYVRTTCGIYYIKYVPKADRFRVPGCPWVLVQDMVGSRIVLNGPEHLHRLAKQIPEIAWILRNTNYSDGLFSMAARHPGIKMPFCLDVVKYGEMILEKAKEKGIDIDGKPFVSCVRSEEHDKLEFARLHGFRKSMIPGPHAYDKIVDSLKAEFNKEPKL